MVSFTPVMTDLNNETQSFYRQAVQLLDNADVPFLVGGAYGLAHYTGIVRHTKDFDVFIKEEDLQRALDAFAGTGYRSEVTFSHWLAKVFNGEDFIDIIYSSGNGIAKVDDLWFEHSVAARFLGEPVHVCPVEESIWSKGFICERERFDGADINHLLLRRAPLLDWKRLLWRFGPHWQVLLAHLLMFRFTYPSERNAIPQWVMDELLQRLRRQLDSPAPARRICQGTLLSRTQYVIDLDHWGYADARLDGESDMTCQQADDWTKAGLQQQK